MLHFIVIKHMELELGEKCFHLSGDSSRFQCVLSKPDFLKKKCELIIKKKISNHKQKLALVLMSQLCQRICLLLKTTLLLPPLTIYT